MISFKQYLEESASAPLFHATPYGNAINILRSKSLSPHTEHQKHMLLKKPRDIKKQWENQETAKGISLSRDFNFSVEYRFFDDGVIFEFDQKRLRQRYEIKPINYWNQSVDSSARNYQTESEEFLITNKAIPISLVNKVYIPDSLDYAKVVDIVKILKSLNIEGRTYTVYDRTTRTTKPI